MKLPQQLKTTQRQIFFVAWLFNWFLDFIPLILSGIVDLYSTFCSFLKNYWKWNISLPSFLASSLKPNPEKESRKGIFFWKFFKIEQMFCRTHIDRCLCIWFSTTEEIDEINNLLEKFKLSDQMTLTQHYVGKPISGQHFLLLFIRLKYKFDTMELRNKIKSTEKVLNFTLQFFSVCSAQKLCF